MSFTETYNNADSDTMNLITKRLIAWNNDYTPYIKVVLAFIKILQHDINQAEQCTYIIHTKGKCSVKEADFQTLFKYKELLSDKGIECTIE